jgi:hypothetical protein
MSAEIEKKVETFKRGLLNEALAQCTAEQQAFFRRIFPDGVPESKLVSAIDLCERTIRKNKAGR